jgi:hypothetical protein
MDIIFPVDDLDPLACVARQDKGGSMALKQLDGPARDDALRMPLKAHIPKLLPSMDRTSALARLIIATIGIQLQSHGPNQSCSKVEIMASEIGT